MTAYAELHCLSNFSFLRGASKADELVGRAQRLRYRALAITDECTMSGIVRAHEAAERVGLHLIVGTELRLTDGLVIVLLAENAAGYSTICRWITLARRSAAKGNYRLAREDLAGGANGVLALWVPGEERTVTDGTWVRDTFPDRAWLAVELHRGPDDAARLRALLDLAYKTGLPAVAAGDVHMHVRRRRALQDTLAAIRHRTTIAGGCRHLFRNGERHLRSLEALHAIYPRELLTETVRIADRCRFSLKDLSYEYPRELVPAEHTPSTWLRHLTERGCAWRWPEGVSDKVRAQIEHELALIAELRYEAYFLTVHDIVKYARQEKILCQGRGSAANSAVCFALGITEVDPARSSMLFERFISRERNEPPDIDVDFEHERREEVIQYIYRKYGRERAAIAAAVTCYRTKLAIRDVAKALGLPVDQVDQLSRAFSSWDGVDGMEERVRERGFDPHSSIMRKVIALARELVGFPRHLSQHVGGFVICERPLHELVPVENAAMPDRTILQWDKDDLDALRLLKIDILALGMLTCIRKSLDLLRAHRGRDLTMASIPAEDAATYQMIQHADTVGVFQIESRAQRATLPRTRPATFYDLVIEVALIRPGPIQGDMVHPYLRRRQGLEPVDYMAPELEEVLKRTLGIPLFQEQVMELAMKAAGFSAGEADQLRRAMAAWKRNGNLQQFEQKLIDGMLARGHPMAFAERLVQQVRGYSGYGFPESHASSFALITYASCWLKCHEPAAFACALLNSQPMGFYLPNQILSDVRRHGVDVLPVDVRYSDWDCVLAASGEAFAIRLGMRQVFGLSEDVARRIECARAVRAFESVQDLCERANLDARAQALLAKSAALRGIAGHRHRARWAVAGVEKSLPLFGRASAEEERIAIAPPSIGADVNADFRSMGLSLGPHPISLVRSMLSARKIRSSRDVNTMAHGARVRTAGIVTMRQRPQSASGVTFVTLEDEFGDLNLVVWRNVAEEQRQQLLGSTLLGVDGKVDAVDGVRHVIAERLTDWSHLLHSIDTSKLERNWR